MLNMMLKTEKKMSVISNEKIDNHKLARASKIILELQKELPEYIRKGSGPFLAAIFDESGNLIAKEANSVVSKVCSHNHAEMNTIASAEQKLETYDLSKHNLSLYVTSEPCIMCLGGIMWSGIKAVYYGVSSRRVEEIQNKFKKRGITVYGCIETEAGEAVLKSYVQNGYTVYKPER